MAGQPSIRPYSRYLYDRWVEWCEANRGFRGINAPIDVTRFHGDLRHRVANPYMSERRVVQQQESFLPTFKRGFLLPRRDPPDM